MIYFGNTAVFFRLKRNQIGHVVQILSLLQNAVVTTKRMNCIAFTANIDYFGHVN